MSLPVKFRTCLLHPTKLAVTWSGHVHMRTPLGYDSIMTVGLCKECRKWEDYEYKNNGNFIANHGIGCEGCYGNYTGSFR